MRTLDETRLLILNSGRFDYQFTIGSLCNPGSTQWECLLGVQGPNGKPLPSPPVCGYINGSGDVHCYPQVPQSYEDIRLLRTMGQGQQHVFLTEYGIGSAVNWPRVFRQYEQIGKPEVEDAQFYKRIRDAVLADWARYKMDDTWADLDEYLDQCIAKMAGQRREGLNAIRANPSIIGHSMTGTIDQGLSGEGLWTIFRELKPGTMDALAEGWAPLKWCLFAQPENVYCGAKVKLEAVLANEDALPAGRLSRAAPGRRSGWRPDPGQDRHGFHLQAGGRQRGVRSPVCAAGLRRGRGHRGPRGQVPVCRPFPEGGGGHLRKDRVLRGRSGGNAESGNRSRPLGR